MNTIVKFLLKILEPIRLYFFKRKWFKNNKHNFTNVNNRFNIDKVIVGKATYGNLNILFEHHNESMLQIGNYCSIADDVKFMLSGEHNYRYVSTYPFKRKIINKESELICKGPIIVKDDVWIGQNSLILSGVTLGQGCIIGAGSIVRKDVPPYAIYVGDRVVKYRFSEEDIQKLIKINFSKLNKELIIENISLLYDEELLEFFKSDLYMELTSN